MASASPPQIQHDAIELVVLKTSPVGNVGDLIDAVSVIGDAIGIVNPWAGIGVKALAVTSGWYWNRRKFDRARPILDDVVEAARRSHSEFVRREEFADLLEDALKRVSESPDGDRRETMRRILLRTIEEPREHVENRRYLRIADELPSIAWRVLQALDTMDWPIQERSVFDERGWAGAVGREVGLGDAELGQVVEHLIDERLIGRQAMLTTPVTRGPGCLRGLFTPAGSAFMKYARE